MKLIDPSPELARGVVLSKLIDWVELDGWHWRWVRSKFKNGYGQYRHTKKSVYTTMAHRWFYVALWGRIAEETLDHGCRIKDCVNPDHLTPKSNRSNILLGDSPPARNSRKTHCWRGHELSGGNVRLLTGRGGLINRACKTCIALSSAKANAKKKEVRRLAHA